MNNFELINFEKINTEYYHLLTYDKIHHIYNLCIMRMSEPQLSYEQNSQNAYGGIGAAPIVCFASYPTFNFSAIVTESKVIQFHTLNDYFNYMREQQHD